jgi:tRNA-dihydrouridine synthase
MKIHLAPLQGFTDYIFRNTIKQVIPHIDYFYTPYLSLENDFSVKKSKLDEIKPQNNSKTQHLIPQLLFSSVNELKELLKYIDQHQYPHLNLNLGCPHPPVLSKNRGAGLMKNDQQIDKALDFLFKRDISVSIKMRLGITNPNEYHQALFTINKYPVKWIILHPRTAKQMYRDTPNYDAFRSFLKKTSHQVIYNGDICNQADLKSLSTYFNCKEIMIGRGVIADPLLPAKLKNPDSEIKTELLEDFLKKLLNNWIIETNNENIVLNKMKNYWIYLKTNPQFSKKLVKKIIKSSTLDEYIDLSSAIFNNMKQ